MKKVLIRVDASHYIGNGHVIRCLALASELKARGINCEFACCSYKGNLIEYIQQKGYVVHALSFDRKIYEGNFASAASCRPEESSYGEPHEINKILKNESFDWVIVDHYGIDWRWEREIACNKILIIDDLANRKHQCDVLVDQNLGRKASDYHEYVSRKTKILTGPSYALLRPAYAMLRNYSLNRRKQKTSIQSILVSMGGVDNDNVTVEVLDALKNRELPTELKVKVVLGSNAPWIDVVRRKARAMPFDVQVLTNVENMAELMAECDIAIGAGGSTTWERCCLGVPSIVIAVAENQRFICNALTEAGCALVVDKSAITTDFGLILSNFLKDRKALSEMITNAAAICDGLGAQRVVNKMLEFEDVYEDNGFM